MRWKSDRLYPTCVLRLDGVRKTARSFLHLLELNLYEYDVDRRCSRTMHTHPQTLRLNRSAVSQHLHSTGISFEVDQFARLITVTLIWFEV